MKGQFFVMAAIVLVFNLIVINQFIAKSAPPQMTEQFEEINYAKTFEENLRSVEDSPPYLLKRNLELFELSSQKAASRGFAVSISCCKQGYCLANCERLAIVNTTNLTVRFALTGDSIELHSELPFR